MAEGDCPPGKFWDADLNGCVDLPTSADAGTGDAPSAPRVIEAQLPDGDTVQLVWDAAQNRYVPLEVPLETPIPGVNLPTDPISAFMGDPAAIPPITTTQAFNFPEPSNTGARLVDDPRTGTQVFVFPDGTRVDTACRSRRRAARVRGRRSWWTPAGSSTSSTRTPARSRRPASPRALARKPSGPRTSPTWKRRGSSQRRSGPAVNSSPVARTPWIGRCA